MTLGYRNPCFWDEGMTVRSYPTGEDAKGILDYTRIRGSDMIHSSLFDYIVIFLKRYAPATVIAKAKPPITAQQTTGLIWDTPVRPYRIPSTP